MINLSANPADFREIRSVDSARETVLSLNEIETLFELVAESVFGESIPDSEDEDTDSSFNSIDLFSPLAKHNGIVLDTYSVQHFSFYQPIVSFVHTEPNALPPKQV